MRGLEDLGSLGKGSRNVWRGSKGIAQQQAIAALPRNLDGQGRLGRFGVSGKTNASYPYALPACFIPLLSTASCYPSSPGSILPASSSRALANEAWKCVKGSAAPVFEPPRRSKQSRPRAGERKRFNCEQIQLSNIFLVISGRDRAEELLTSMASISYTF